MSKISESDLEHIANIRNGDEEAFSSLFREYYEQLYLFAGRFVKDPQSAENIVQDVFVRLWEQRTKLVITSNVKSYLFTAVKNHSLNHIKREKRLVTIDEQLDIAKNCIGSPEDEFIRNESFLSVQKAIDSLPEKCRMIYLMKRYDDLSYIEIGEILGITVNTIKTQMKRAIKTLNEKLVHLKMIIVLFLLKNWIVIRGHKIVNIRYKICDGSASTV